MSSGSFRLDSRWAHHQPEQTTRGARPQLAAATFRKKGNSKIKSGKMKTLQSFLQQLGPLAWLSTQLIKFMKVIG